MYCLKFIILSFLVVFAMPCFAQSDIQTAEQVKAVTELTAMFVSGYNILLLFVLIGIGAIAKALPTKLIPDWSIVTIIPLLGCILGIGLLSFTTHDYPWLVSLLIGGADGIAAVFGHQYLKQNLQSPAGKILLKIPFMTTLAALLGIDVSQPTSPDNKPTP